MDPGVKFRGEPSGGFVRIGRGAKKKSSKRKGESSDPKTTGEFKLVARGCLLVLVLALRLGQEVLWQVDLG